MVINHIANVNFTCSYAYDNLESFALKESRRVYIPEWMIQVQTARNFNNFNNSVDINKHR